MARWGNHITLPLHWTEKWICKLFFQQLPSNWLISHPTIALQLLFSCSSLRANYMPPSPPVAFVAQDFLLPFTLILSTSLMQKLTNIINLSSSVSINSRTLLISIFHPPTSLNVFWQEYQDASTTNLVYLLQPQFAFMGLAFGVRFFIKLCYPWSTPHVEKNTCQ